MFKKHLQLDAAAKAEFDACGQSYEKKREAKKRLAQVTLEHKTAEKRKAVSATDLQAFADEYCSCSRIWDREGRDVAGFTCAMNYVSSVAAKWMQGQTFHGHAYIKYDDDRKLALVLHLRETLASSSKSEWSLIQKECSAPSAASDSPAPPAALGAQTPQKANGAKRTSEALSAEQAPDEKRKREAQSAKDKDKALTM